MVLKGEAAPQLESIFEDDESQSETPPWKPSRHELMIMATLATLSLMVSLDSSIIVTSLSVRHLCTRANLFSSF